MKQAISTVQLRKLLEDGLAQGYWTMEDLDRPPPGYIQALADWKAHCRLQSARLGKTVQCNFPEYKNLLR